ncbi:hypothetical protein [Parabacteroides sp. FAFU027]|uniref:hypothetical protein n=1 Tax=Parabacteroides sp. FAFU027 TaxID=2922715 RepID=UPI001FAEC6BD|nr:hypothetical protein [Parabacteroides sp. FAFU027]
MRSSQFKHEQNVTSMEEMISRVETFGEKYQPSRSVLLISNLSKLKEDGGVCIEETHTATVLMNNAISFRKTLYGGFDKYVTRINNAVKVSGASNEVVDQFQSIIRELRSQRSSEKPDNTESAENATDPESKSNTLHLAAYDRKASNFNRLVVFLKEIPEYKPNEPDLTIEAISAKSVEYKNANLAITSASVLVDTHTNKRDQVLYEDGIGLVDVGLAVKNYVKSAFGAGSAQYKAVSNISFNK